MQNGLSNIVRNNWTCLGIYIELYKFLEKYYNQSMGQLIMAMLGIAILSIAILVCIYLLNAVVHEVGHYVCARICGARLIKIQFPLLLVEKKNRGYSLKWNRTMFRNECMVTEATRFHIRISSMIISLGGVLFQGLLIVCMLGISSYCNCIWNLIFYISSVISGLFILINLNIFGKSEICDGIVVASILFEPDGAREYYYFHKMQRLLYEDNQMMIEQEMELLNISDWNYKSRLAHFNILLVIQWYIDKSEYEKALRLLDSVLIHEKYLLDDKKKEFQWIYGEIKSYIH